MLIAFILALIMLVVAEPKGYRQITVYVVVPILLSLIANAIFVIIVPEQATTTVTLVAALWQRFLATLTGLMFGALIRICTVGKLGKGKR